MNESLLSGIFAMSFGIILLVILIVIAAYVIWSLAVFKVLKKLGSDYPWMAWIPILSSIALAREANDGTGNVDVFGLKVPVTVFMFWPVAELVLSFIPGLSTVVCRVFSGICGGLAYRSVFAKCEGKEEKDMLILGLVSGFIPIVALVKFLCYKKDNMAAFIN